MMTPQEVSQHAFAKASFGGYNMAMVDDFLDALTEDYTTLYKENAVLKSKMKVLVDKIEEYRATEDAMRMTLLSAQKTANAIVAEAESKREQALCEAEREISGHMEALRHELEHEQARLAAAKASTADYVAKLRELYDHEQQYLARLSELAPPPPKEADPAELAAEEIETSVQRMTEEERPAPTDPPEEIEEPRFDEPARQEPARQEPARQRRRRDEARTPAGEEQEPAWPEDDEPTVRINLESLQFGRDYELK